MFQRGSLSVFLFLSFAATIPLLACSGAGSGESGADFDEPVFERDFDTADGDTDVEDLFCGAGDVGCDDGWTTSCIDGVWVRIIDCHAYGTGCEAGKCVGIEGDVDQTENGERDEADGDVEDEADYEFEPDAENPDIDVLEYEEEYSDIAEAEHETEEAEPYQYPPAGEIFLIEGFGADTLGGWQEGHDVYHVTTLADSGAGSLREGMCSSNNPRIVLFDLDGEINLSSPLLVPSNISIDGRGRDITIKGKGFVIPGSDQVILINLALEDIGPDTEDGVQIGSALPDSSENIVLDHLRFTQHDDGGNCKNVDEAVSIVFGSRNITIAWCRFDAWEKVLLAGNGDADAALDSQISLTWHHSYANNTGRRHPQARYGRFHLYNNFWDNWHMYGSGILEPYHESFGSQIQDDGRMLLEGQMVRRHPGNPLYEAISTANQASRCESGGDLLEYGTWIDPSSTAQLQLGVGCMKLEAFEPPYVVHPQAAGQALRDEVIAGSGNTL